MTLRGVTTDGSHLYPDPRREVCGEVPHQICVFQVVKEIVTAVLSAVASARKGLAAKQPKVPKGRPSTQVAKKTARRKKRLEQKGADLFTHRYLFVKHPLSPSERKRLWRITRGLPQLRKLREIMEQVYALFDLGESLKKLFSPTLEKALALLEDKLLPAASNVVERGNRQYRKMQKSIYSVRTQEHIKARIALDMWREAQGERRDQTLRTLHEAHTR